MQLSIPVFVHSERPQGKKTVEYTVRPLFFDGFVSQDMQLSKATARCVRHMRRQLGRMGREGKHEELVRCTFSPNIETRRIKLEIELKSSWRRETFFVVCFRAFDRWIAFLPQLDEIWFELTKLHKLESRTKDVVTQFLREKERDDEDIDVWLQQIHATGRHWVSTVDFDVDVARKPTSLKKDLASFFSGPAVSDGATELENVGRCLDTRFPDGLMRCVRQDAVANQLSELLGREERRPIMIVGRRLAGKTSLIHEVIFQKRKNAPGQFRSKDNTWLIAPQRLISGMSYVGQWENRLLAILKHAREKNHTLYFDDLIGLFRAGLSRDSDLSVAQVIKPWISRRDVRVLAEITPEALRVLREQDRAFADMFHIVRLDEPNEDDALRILISVIRELEQKHRVEFETNVIPVVRDLCRRFQRDAAFPGSAAEIMRSLASQNAGSRIHRTTVLVDFSQRSGLQHAFIDQSTRLKRGAVVEGLQRGLVGQNAAVDAVADRICLARARLNDPSRPLGSFLLAGPTGVGKTQCARALADYLYGAPDRMVRFDMNEFVSYDAAARLVGTFASPEGLLTSAVRRQPFSVVLLDEIEKAHPDVFDLLLQVLGEGRLTDALGHTVDFGNTFVIMTSNLGSRTSSGSPGFGTNRAQSGAFMKAVENFFRPEFVNRLDQIIPFEPLKRDEIQRISRRLIENVSQREGFARRRCILHPHERVLDLIVQRGFDPRWGARGVRREIEKTVLRPVATELAKTTHTSPTIIGLNVNGNSIDARVVPLVNAAPIAGTVSEIEYADVPEIVARIREFLARSMQLSQEFRPTSELTAGAIDPEYFHYLNTVELIRVLELGCDRLLSQQKSPDLNNTIVSSSRSGRRKNFDPNHRYPSARRILAELISSDDINDYLAEGVTALPQDEMDAFLQRVLQHCCLLNKLLPTPDGGWHDERAIAIIRPLQAGLWGRPLALNYNLNFPFTDDEHKKLRATAADNDSRWSMGLEFDYFGTSQWKEQKTRFPKSSAKLESLDAQVVLLEGSCAYQLLRLEQGTHLTVAINGSLQLSQMIVEKIAHDETADDAAYRILQKYEQSSENSVAIDSPENPLRIQPVVRFYKRSLAFDLRSFQSDADDIRMDQRLLYLLPAPPELLNNSVAAQQSTSDERLDTADDHQGQGDNSDPNKPADHADGTEA